MMGYAKDTRTEMAKSRRKDIRNILKDLKLRRELMTKALIVIQAREGIETSQVQAEQAYDKVQYETQCYTESHISLLTMRSDDEFYRGR